MGPLLSHVVNHSTHHRGQVSGFLRAMNYTPPPLDLVAYHRQRTA
ncbi:MAG: DinB family protein [Bryobacteraceae bacterium]